MNSVIPAPSRPICTTRAEIASSAWSAGATLSNTLVALAMLRMFRSENEV